MNWHTTTTLTLAARTPHVVARVRRAGARARGGGAWIVGRGSRTAGGGGVSRRVPLLMGETHSIGSAPPRVRLLSPDATVRYGH